MSFAHFPIICNDSEHNLDFYLFRNIFANIDGMMLTRADASVPNPQRCVQPGRGNLAASSDMGSGFPFEQQCGNPQRNAHVLSTYHRPLINLIAFPVLLLKVFDGTVDGKYFHHNWQISVNLR